MKKVSLFIAVLCCLSFLMTSNLSALAQTGKNVKSVTKGVTSIKKNNTPPRNVVRVERNRYAEKAVKVGTLYLKLLKRNEWFNVF